MKYQYRWYYAIVISMAIVIMGYVYDLHPTFSRLINMRQSESSILKKLKRYRQKIVTYNAADTKNIVQRIEPSFYLADILALVSVSGLVAQTVKVSVEQVHDDQMELIHLVTLGQFHQAAAFFYAIARQEFPVLITNFTYKKSDKNIFSMGMDVLVWKEKTNHFSLEKDNLKVLPDPNNPFCSSENLPMNQENDASVLPIFALSQVKMQGYLQQGGRQTALILLPNNSVVAIQKGAVIGKEHAVVTDVFRDHMQLVLPDRQKKTVMMMR